VAWKVVAQLFGLHWNTVRRAVKDVVDYGLQNRDLDNVLYIGIDEISRKRGHVYHTQVYDLIQKRLLWSGEDRTSQTLEAFRQFWTYAYPAWAKKYLDQWFWWATHSRLKPLRDFAWMIRRHQHDILNYFKIRIDNAAVEALNNKAKVISHRAYGYRTAETFTLALLHGLGKLPVPELTHKSL